MNKKKKIPFITIHDKDGRIIEEFFMTAADDDWIRAARLHEKALKGDKKAAAELKRMENTDMVEFDPEDHED